MVIVRHNKCISPLASWFATLGGLAEMQGKIGEVGPPVNGRLLLHIPLFALRAQRGILLCEAIRIRDAEFRRKDRRHPMQKTAQALTPENMTRTVMLRLVQPLKF